MQLEASRGSAFQAGYSDWDPFAGATGYHRIAVDTIKALSSGVPRAMVLNVSNGGSMSELNSDDVVEVTCMIDKFGPRPLASGTLPEAVRGLVLSVKQFERETIKAAVQERWDQALYALMCHPVVGSWDAARRFLGRLAEADTEYFTAFQHREILQSSE